MLYLTLLLPLLLFSDSGCNDSHHYYVTTDRTDCPSDDFIPCHQLSYYMKHEPDFTFFTRDSAVIEFLPGLHELEGFAGFYSVQNLTIIGSNSFKSRGDYSYSTSVVSCANFSSFLFAFIDGLSIVNITFSHCGATPMPFSFLSFYTALFIVYPTSLWLEGVTVEKSYGTGLMSHNAGNCTITSCNFIDNNEHLQKHRECADPNDHWSCIGGNVRLLYFQDFIKGYRKPVHYSISNSRFAGGVAAINPELEQWSMNSLAGGLAIQINEEECDILVTIEDCIFTNNSGLYGGNIGIGIYLGDTDKYVDISVRIHQCEIHHGYTELAWPQPSLSNTHAAGIAVHVLWAKDQLDRTVSLHISNTNFSYNLGGAIALSIHAIGTTICKGKGIKIALNNCNIVNNQAVSFSAGMHVNILYQKPTVFESVLDVQVIVQSTRFHDNIEYRESVGILKFHQLPKVTIVNSTFVNNSGSPAIYLYKSKLYLQGRVLFQKNTNPTDGGALYLHENSLLYFHHDTRVDFTENAAGHRGGAIYVESLTEIGVPYCFFQLEEVKKYETANVQIVFKDNSAQVAGDALYGGRVDSCYIYSLPMIRHFILPFLPVTSSGIPSVKVFDSLFNFDNSTHSPSLISSNPIRMCFCNTSTISFAGRQTLEKEIYPGQLFEVEVVAVGQYNGTTPAVATATVIDGNTTEVLEAVQVAQETHITCTKLQYRILSNKSYEVIQLQPAGVPQEFVDHSTDAILNVTLLECPPFFEMKQSYKRCDCDSWFNQYNITCNITNQKITKMDTAWFSHDPSSGLLVHPHCPFDYCKVGLLSFKVSRPGEQCAFNRAGVLCGACLPGFSLALGTSRCLRCSNFWLFLSLPFVLAGLALVFALLKLNLTVSTGTIHALIFYVNVIRVNHAVFFPPGDRSVYSIFIAWLNLDLGIETCFYEGMDGYAKIWLQLVFPIYIWLMVVIVIVLSRRYVFASRLFGSHAVPVLATLFLLSYAKILRTIIAMLSFTVVHSKSAASITVWLYDGNIDYMELKHVLQFLVAVVFSLCFVLPFTLLVLLAPCLQAHSNRRVLKWVHRLKPFLDAYQGPYGDKFRCWTGAMLVVRNILFLAFALNGLNNPIVNLELIITAVFCLLGCMWLAGGVYKLFILNLLEAFFIVKLGIFSAWTIFIHQNTSNPVHYQRITAYGITTTTLLIFLAIIAHRVFCLLNMKQVMTKFCKLQPAQKDNNQHPLIGSGTVEVHAPTVSYIDMQELREPLLSEEDQQT